jgi:hypothetical protein
MDYEYAPLRIPSHTDRATAAAQLTIAAEYSGWELARVLLLRDGTRQVTLRRRLTGYPVPPKVTV